MSTSDIQDTLMKALVDDKTPNSTEEDEAETPHQVLTNLADKIQNGEMAEDVSNNSEEDNFFFFSHPPEEGSNNDSVDSSQSPKRAPRIFS